MHTLTESPLMLGAVTASGLGPILLLSVWGGVVADKVNRLRFVRYTRSVFGLLAIFTGILIATDSIVPWHIIAISACTGVLLAFDLPSRQAILPGLIPKENLVNAVAVYSLVTAGSAIIGPGIFAPIVGVLGLEGLFFLIGAAYALTVVALLAMKPIPHLARSKRSTIMEDLTSGISYVWHHQMIMGVLGVGILGGIFGLSFETLLPIFADTILSGDVYTYSVLLLAAGIGGMVGTIFLAAFGNTRNAPAIQVVVGIGMGLGLVVFSQAGWLPVAVAVIALVGSFTVTFLTINNSIVQTVVAEEFRGRVMSLHQLTWGSMAIGGLLMGILSELWGADTALMIGGIVTASGTFLISRFLPRKIENQ
jgi:MFS family permease